MRQSGPRRGSLAFDAPLLECTCSCSGQLYANLGRSIAQWHLSVRLVDRCIGTADDRGCWLLQPWCCCVEGLSTADEDVVHRSAVLPGGAAIVLLISAAWTHITVKLRGCSYGAAVMRALRDASVVLRISAATGAADSAARTPWAIASVGLLIDAAMELLAPLQ